MNGQKRRTGRLALSVIALLTLLGALAAPAAATADITGSTYTSPDFGFTVTWDASWFVVEEVNDEFDFVRLTNGVTFATVGGGIEAGGMPQLAIVGTLMSFRQATQVSNLQVKLDANGSPMQGTEENRAWVFFTYTLTFDDGSTMDFTAYEEARVLIPGQALVELFSLTPSMFFDNEWPAIEQLFSTVTIPGQEGPATGDAGPAEPLVGEPAPVFVSGPWRVAVRIAAENGDFPDLRLKEKDGKEWLVIVADVTNWSSQPAVFNAREFFLRPGDDAELIKTAPSSTSSVAKQLELEPVADDLTVAFAPDETQRVVLVYSIPARSREIALVRETEALPIADALEISIDPDDLPQAALPPVVELGTFVSASDGRTFRVTLKDEAKSTRMLLLGVEPPEEGECYDTEAEKVLDDLANKQVLVETDGALDDGETPSRYIWLINADGTRTLVNEMLVSDGLAAADRLPFDARFGAWIGESERMAQAAGTGLWGGCEEELTGASEEQAADVTFEIEMVDIAFVEKELVVPANTEITINLVNNGVAVHTFNIDELDVASGDVASGETASVTFNTGAPGEYEYYCSIPGHREAGMVGTLIVQEAGS